jgi:hypothetical protein
LFAPTIRHSLLDIATNHESPMPRQKPIKPEQPRSEPEIIPPPRGRTQAYQAGPDWFAPRDGGSGSNRIFVARLGPWSLIGIVLLIGLFTGAILAIMLGALLIAIPVVGLLIAGALIANALRTRLRR